MGNVFLGNLEVGMLPKVSVVAPFLQDHGTGVVSRSGVNTEGQCFWET